MHPQVVTLLTDAAAVACFLSPLHECDGNDEQPLLPSEDPPQADNRWVIAWVDVWVRTRVGACLHDTLGEGLTCMDATSAHPNKPMAGCAGNKIHSVDCLALQMAALRSSSSTPRLRGPPWAAG